MNILSSKNIVLGITGSIAAYKAADIASKLKKEGCNTKIVMTRSAESFITKTTLECLSPNPVLVDGNDADPVTNFAHLDLAKWTDMILIAPCTANFMNKLANGHGDDLLSTICLACTKDIFIAPAMNPNMWENKITQNNLKKLHSANIKILGPGYGEHACGDTGYGKMLDPISIIENIKNENSENELNGVNVLVTAGPTREPIDPVRYITNYSSGKMGYAIATAAKELGANVELISGPVQLKPIPKVKTSYVQTSKDMMDMVMERVVGQDIFISVAAIADYKPKDFSAVKHKKHEKNLKIEFQRGLDILKTVSEKHKNIFMVGFSAETDNLKSNTLHKMEEKGLDIIVGNIANHEKGLGFESDYNEVVIFGKDEVSKVERAKKIHIAKTIMSFISKSYSKKLSLVKSDAK